MYSQVPPVLLEHPAGLTISSTLNMYRPRTMWGTPDRWARTLQIGEIKDQGLIYCVPWECSCTAALDRPPQFPCDYHRWRQPGKFLVVVIELHSIYQSNAIQSSFARTLKHIPKYDFPSPSNSLTLHLPDLEFALKSCASNPSLS